MKLTCLSRTEWIEESNNEVDDNGKWKRAAAPQRDMTTEPEQQRIGYTQPHSTAIREITDRHMWTYMHATSLRAILTISRWIWVIRLSSWSRETNGTKLSCRWTTLMHWTGPSPITASWRIFTVCQKAEWWPVMTIAFWCHSYQLPEIPRQQ